MRPDCVPEREGPFATVQYSRGLNIDLIQLANMISLKLNECSTVAMIMIHDALKLGRKRGQINKASRVFSIEKRGKGVQRLTHGGSTSLGQHGTVVIEWLMSYKTHTHPGQNDSLWRVPRIGGILCATAFIGRRAW